MGKKLSRLSLGQKTFLAVYAAFLGVCVAMACGWAVLSSLPGAAPALDWIAWQATPAAAQGSNASLASEPPSATPTVSTTASPTWTPTPSATATSTPTPTPSFTPTATWTATPSPSPTATPPPASETPTLAPSPAPATPALPLGTPSQNEIQAYMALLDSNRLAQGIATLTQDYGPRHNEFYSPYVDNQCTLGKNRNPTNNLVRALEYSASELEKLGYRIKRERVKAPFAYNVIGVKDGSLYPEKYLDIGAHIDSVPESPGAADNASGAAAVLELARALQTYPNRYTWRFILFTGEEYGVVGSQQHARQSARRGDDIRMALVLDGIGWSEAAPRQMNCIWPNAKLPLTMEVAHMFDAIRAPFSIDIEWRICGSDGSQSSDNLAYWASGYPAVLSAGGFPYTPPTYHNCKDTVNRVDIQNAFKTTQQNLAVLLMLDGMAP